MRLNPSHVLQQIDALKVAFPSIWSDDDEKLLTDCLEAETDLQEFMRVVVDRIHEASSMAGAIAGRIAELEIRQRRYEEREKAMRSLAFRLMEAAELKKLELPECTLSIRNGQPKVIITDEKALPDSLCRIKREPDRTKIKASLTNGFPVSGAALSNAEPSLTVRTK